MSCVVAYKSDNSIIMGADTRITVGTHTRDYNHPKIWRRENYLLGFVGDTRGQQIVQSFFTISSIVDEDSIYLYWPTALQELFSIHSFGVNKKHEPAKQGCAFLLAYNGDIYHIFGDYSILKVERPYHAIGSGEDYALGAFHSMEGYSNMSAQRKCEKALAASAEFHTQVARPFEFVTLGA